MPKRPKIARNAYPAARQLVSLQRGGGPSSYATVIGKQRKVGKFDVSDPGDGQEIGLNNLDFASCELTAASPTETRLLIDPNTAAVGQKLLLTLTTAGASVNVYSGLAFATLDDGAPAVEFVVIRTPAGNVWGALPVAILLP